MVGTGYNFSETYKALNVLKRFYFLIYDYKRVKPEAAAKFYHILDTHKQRHNISNILKEVSFRSTFFVDSLIMTITQHSFI